MVIFEYIQKETINYLTPGDININNRIAEYILD